jgi:hypothetical protein
VIFFIVDRFTCHPRRESFVIPEGNLFTIFYSWRDSARFGYPSGHLFSFVQKSIGKEHSSEPNGRDCDRVSFFPEFARRRWDELSIVLLSLAITSP